MDKPIHTRMTVTLPDSHEKLRPARRVIQIAAAFAGQASNEPDLVTLCNDGTMWIMGVGGQWHQLPAIPQEETDQ